MEEEQFLSEDTDDNYDDIEYDDAAGGDVDIDYTTQS